MNGMGRLLPSTEPRLCQLQQGAKRRPHSSGAIDWASDARSLFRDRLMANQLVRPFGNAWRAVENELNLRWLWTRSAAGSNVVNRTGHSISVITQNTQIIQVGRQRGHLGGPS
jgi:hypothetical protein